LIESKALVNLLDEDGNTPLHLAALNMQNAAIM
jgi:ankyrin repeat protein